MSQKVKLPQGSNSVANCRISTPRRHVPIEKGSYIAGFVDGEGSFYLSVRKRQDYSTGWKFSLHFNISNADKAVLEQCKKYLQCGKVRTIKKNDKLFYMFEVSDKHILRTIIIPFFTRFSFLSNKKKAEFRIFDKALQFMEQTHVCDHESLEKLLEYRRQLNELRSTQTHYTDAEIRTSFRGFTEKQELTTRSTSPNATWISDDIKKSSETIR